MRTMGRQWLALGLGALLGGAGCGAQPCLSQGDCGAGQMCDGWGMCRSALPTNQGGLGGGGLQGGAIPAESAPAANAVEVASTCVDWEDAQAQPEWGTWRVTQALLEGRVAGLAPLQGQLCALSLTGDPQTPAVVTFNGDLWTADGTYVLVLGTLTEQTLGSTFTACAATGPNVGRGSAFDFDLQASPETVSMTESVERDGSRVLDVVAVTTLPESAGPVTLSFRLQRPMF